MDRKTPILWFLRTALGLMLLIGLLPISHFLSMQSEHMQMPFHIGVLDGAMPAEQSIPTTCCNDAFGSFSSMCGFVISDSACAAYPAGIDQVAFSTFSIQTGSREIVTPPPKI